MAEEVVRSMPHSIEAEQIILGSIIFDNECMPDISAKIKIEDFYIEQHKNIFEAMLNISNRAEPIDLVTLQSELGEKFDSAGGAQYLTQLRYMVSTTANLKYHIQIVKDKAILRRLIRAAGEITEKSYNSDNDVSQVINIAENKILEISQGKEMSDIYHIRDILASNLSKIEELMKNKGNVTGVPTGFDELDKRTAGLQPTDLILIAARPSMGKTSFAVNIATNAAVRYKKSVAIFSLEMGKEQLANRILSSEALISSGKMRVGDLDANDAQRLVNTMEYISSANIYIDDTPGITIAEIRAKCRRLSLKGQLDMIVIDYLQLMSGSGRDSRQQEVSENSRLLKILAKELKVPVIALSQLNREADKRGDHKPQLSDLRDSGAIEQDADIVMFLYREAKYDQSADQNVAEVIIAKHRNGSTDSFNVGWRGEYTQFSNLDTIHTEPQR